MRCSIRWYIEKAFNCCSQTTVWPTRGTDRRPFQSRPESSYTETFSLLGYKNGAILARLLGRAAQIHAPGFMNRVAILLKPDRADMLKILADILFEE